ncbi:MAG: lysophospholipid acyltransferase family protein [Lautropia sp.]
MFEDPGTARSAAWVRCFDAIFERRLRRAFHAVRVSRPRPTVVAAHAPLVVYCNHPSWWDAALMPVLLARLFPQREAFGPIDADALARYRFMRRLGFFGVERDSYAGAATFLRTGRRVLASPHALLGVTPQGGFGDPRRRPVRLRPGLAALIARVPRVTVLPIAIEYPFWDERLPEALVRLGDPMAMGRLESGSAPDVRGTLERELARTMDALAEDAMSRDPARFATLIEGRAGVGGIYDGWRRLRAWRAGVHFDPAHRPTQPAMRRRGGEGRAG